MRINIPCEVNYIINKLNENSHEAYIVGGCVRDALLNKEPNDWDVTTSATPEEIKSIFKDTNRICNIGEKHGTIGVVINRETYEITTYRIDGTYSDNRKPDEVEFTTSLKEDLKRRDFTINAMAYNNKDGLIDLFGGKDDLNNKLIRCVGNPQKRFTEDALRIMRMIRFAAQLDFRIDTDTAETAANCSNNLSLISKERIRDELIKIITSDNPEKLTEMYLLNITHGTKTLRYIDQLVGCQQNTPHHIYDVFEHTIQTLKNIENDEILRLTMLFHDIGKPNAKTVSDMGFDRFIGHEKEGERITREIMKELRFDNATIDKVTTLVRYHDYRVSTSPRAVRRALSKIGADLFPLYIKVRLADIAGQSDFEKQSKINNIHAVRALYKTIIESNQAFTLKDLEINGNDLIKLGIKPGPRLGEILKDCLDLVIEDPKNNNKEHLLKLIETIVNKD